MAKKEEEKKETEQTLLQELCGADAALYACLSTHLYETPLAAISSKDLDVLTAEAEKSGNFRPALDKAIFEGARTPGERERYVQAIRNIAARTLRAMEQEREAAQKEGLTGLTASLQRRIESQTLLNERAEEILDVASRFYNEKLVELEESSRRQTRGDERKQSESEEKKIDGLEKAAREARKEAWKGMDRVARREAKKQDKREERAAEEKKAARKEAREKAEKEEKRIGEQEKEGREARRDERKGH